MQILSPILEHHWTLGIWAGAVVLCEAFLVLDLWRRNREIRGMMRLVWMLTVAYSGPFGLWLYWVTGRKQIPDDSIWRRGGRSVAHCYSGCGLGEVIGLLITVGIFSLGSWWVLGVTFVLAFVAGFVLTVAPLMQEGTPWKQALVDAFYSESASITVMELAALAVDLLLGGSTNLAQPRFWTSMVLSLSCGLLAAYPVNVLLIHLGIKKGMRDPRAVTHGT